MHHAGAAAANAGAALFATGLHAVSYFAATAFMALLVFDKLGVGILRRAWFNLDFIWAGALVATGCGNPGDVTVRYGGFYECQTIRKAIRILDSSVCSFS